MSPLLPIALAGLATAVAPAEKPRRINPVQLREAARHADVPEVARDREIGAETPRLTGIQAFHRESRPLIQRVQADPGFAGWVFKNEGEPHAIVLFTGDAAAHLGRYTRDPRYRPKSANLTRPQLRALRDSLGQLLRQLGIHYTYSSSDEENNQVIFSVSEMDKYREAVATGRLKPHPHITILADMGPIARSGQSAGPVSHFPQFKFPGRLMDAALSGKLEVKNGCLTVGDSLILWPSGARLAIGTDGVAIVRGGAGAPLRVGDQVRVGGGTAWTNFRGEGLLQPLPAACVGESPVTDKLWIAGEF